MQLKRILARDSRSATDQAIALYGADVLIISNHQVNGQTELVVALDVAAADGHESTLGRVAAPSERTAALSRPDLPHARKDGRANFLDALKQAEKGTTEPLQAEDQPTFKAAVPQSQDRTQTADTKAQDARDYLRGREIVDLVRDELASLRREFRLTQQTASWQQGLQLAADVQPLARALSEAAMPQALRTLLIDTLQDHASTSAALAGFRSILEHTLTRPETTLPSQGVHVIAGPSGAGKTLMATRLARHAEQLHGAAQVALISYHDLRAGAWSQMQMLAAQLGVDCFRAGDAATLALLLNELSPRRLVLIDTPGVQMAERLAEVRATQAGARFHLVVPADASSATLARQTATQSWDSLLLSKLDECGQPWPLLHFLGNNPLTLAGGSHGCSATDLQSTSPLRRLVDLGLDQLASAAADHESGPGAWAVPHSTVETTRAFLNLQAT
jgi:flagellar biosynthesis protein FlhF